MATQTCITAHKTTLQPVAAQSQTYTHTNHVHTRYKKSRPKPCCLNYRVDASGSHDPDGQIVNYRFAYGTNTIDYHLPIVKIWADHLESAGALTLTVTDNQGATGTATIHVNQ